MRAQTSKAKSQQLNTHQKNLETEPPKVQCIYRGGGRHFREANKKQLTCDTITAKVVE